MDINAAQKGAEDPLLGFGNGSRSTPTVLLCTKVPAGAGAHCGYPMNTTL